MLVIFYLFLLVNNNGVSLIPIILKINITGGRVPGHKNPSPMIKKLDTLVLVQSNTKKQTGAILKLWPLMY